MGLFAISFIVIPNLYVLFTLTSKPYLVYRCLHIGIYKHDLGKPYHEGIEGEGELLHIGIYKHDFGKPHLYVH
jgi:hypothetical protein